MTPLLTIKKNLLNVGVFPGCDESCHFCLSSPTSCPLLKAGVQCLIDNKEILFEKTFVPPVSYNDVSIVTIFDNSSKVSTKRPVRITSVPKVASLIITMHGPILYSLDKTVPWNYEGDVYYHGIKQDWPAAEDSSSEKVDSNISNIAGTSKITRSGRIFSPEIAPPKAISGPVIIHVVVAPPKVVPNPAIISANTPVDKTITILVITPTDIPAAESTETRGKSILIEPVRTKAQSLAIPETSRKEMEEILKIIKRSDYDVVEQLG